MEHMWTGENTVTGVCQMCLAFADSYWYVSRRLTKRIHLHDSIGKTDPEHSVVRAHATKGREPNQWRSLSFGLGYVTREMRK